MINTMNTDKSFNTYWFRKSQFINVSCMHTSYTWFCFYCKKGEFSVSVIYKFPQELSAKNGELSILFIPHTHC